MSQDVSPPNSDGRQLKTDYTYSPFFGVLTSQTQPYTGMTGSYPAFINCLDGVLPVKLREFCPPTG